MTAVFGHVGSSGFHLPPVDPVPSPWPVYTKTAETDALPVAIADVREFIGLPSGDTSRDTELTLFVKTAARAIEHHCQVSILDTTWQAAMPEFGERIALNKRPFKTVLLIEYVHETTGTITSVAGDTFHDTTIGQQMGMVWLGHDKSWPDDKAIRHDAVRITFTTGYGTDDTTVPADIKHAILMAVASMDANRGDCESSGGGSVYAMKNSTPSIIPAAAQPLLGPYVFRHLAVA